MSGIALLLLLLFFVFMERGTTEGVMIGISFSANAITLILDCEYYISSRNALDNR